MSSLQTHHMWSAKLSFPQHVARIFLKMRFVSLGGAVCMRPRLFKHDNATSFLYTSHDGAPSRRCPLHVSPFVSCVSCLDRDEGLLY